MPICTNNYFPSVAETQDLTGATSDASTALTVNRWYCLYNNGPDNIFIRKGSSTPTAVVTDLRLLPGQAMEWQVDNDSRYVASIGSSANSKAQVFPISPATY